MQAISRKELDLADEAATESLAAGVAAASRVGDVIALSGDLGAGKTVFARAFVRARCDDEEEVPSPTFTLVQTYDCPEGVIWHFDLFRLEGEAEAWELDMEDAFSAGISLIEWPERIPGLLPADRLDVRLQFGSGGPTRRARLEARGTWSARLDEVGPRG